MGFEFASEEELSATRSGHGTEAPSVPGEGYRNIEAFGSKTSSTLVEYNFLSKSIFRKHKL